MGLQLSARQQAQMAFLERLPPKIQKVASIVEQMNNARLDETMVRQMIRALDESKAGASQLSINGLADALGAMASIARRGGGLQVKIRMLRDQMTAVRQHFEAALRKASEPEEEAAEE
jgi:hypothetical protein